MKTIIITCIIAALNTMLFMEPVSCTARDTIGGPAGIMQPTMNTMALTRDNHIIEFDYNLSLLDIPSSDTMTEEAYFEGLVNDVNYSIYTIIGRLTLAEIEAIGKEELQIKILNDLAARIQHKSIQSLAIVEMAGK